MSLPRCLPVFGALVASTVLVSAVDAQVDTIARFGGIEDAGSLTTFRPRAAALKGDTVVYAQGDGLYLLSSGSSRRLARQGEGPGELRLVLSISVDGESVRVFDAVQRRLTMWTESGDVQTAAFPAVDIAYGTRGYPLSDGTLLAVGSTAFARRLRPRESIRDEVQPASDTVTVTRLAADADPTPVAAYDAAPRYELGRATYRAPGHPRPLIAVAGDYVLIADSHRPDFVVVSGVSGAERRGAAALPPQPFDTSLHRRLVQEFLEEENALGMADPAAIAERRSAVVQAAGEPSFAPLFAEAVLAQSGEVWLREVSDPDDEADTWRVVSPTIADREVALPSGLSVLAIDRSRIVGVVRDELDVATVLLLAVRSP